MYVTMNVWQNVHKRTHKSEPERYGDFMWRSSIIAIHSQISYCMYCGPSGNELALVCKVLDQPLSQKPW